MIKVMIILGSASDKEIAIKSIKILEKLQIPYSLKVASAHRTHDKVKRLVMDATNLGVEVFIGIAGLAAHLPGAIAAYTHRPVIGVPVDGAVGGIDALYACVQMPFPTAVTTVGINRGDNAAILAGEIIASYDDAVAERISDLRVEYQKKVEEGEKELIESLLEGEHFQKDFLAEENYEKIDFEELDDTPDVMILAGSYSDMEIAKNVAILLERMQIEYKLDYISPIRHAKDFESYMSKRNNAKLFIAISGLSALVAGSVVALTEKPVIGVPCSKKLDGQDALLTMANMPPGVPVGTVGIDNGRNAAIVAGEILAISNKQIEENLKWIKYKNADL
nr:5-(carboxyamino)imidazole ribonucleotide mutase [uncultured Methanobrevibacter sp.]